MNQRSTSHLLNHPVSEDYKEYWADLLAKDGEEDQKKEISLLVFRLHEEWLGISTHVFTDVAELRPVHSIPHRTNRILRGTVNYKGQLKLCVNLSNLLEIETSPAPEGKQQRMVAIRQDSEDWIFTVDEICGIIRFDLNKIENVPVTVARSKANFLKGIIVHETMSIGYLEEELLFYSLKRAIQ